MKLKHVMTVFKARNREFFRDRAAFGWNFLFPFLIVIGFAVIFGREDYNAYKVGLFPVAESRAPFADGTVPIELSGLQHIEFVGFPSQAVALDRLRHHKIDFLIHVGTAPYTYWINASSPKGYLMEKIFMAATTQSVAGGHVKQVVDGKQIRYIDWFFPGILAMNMMFSALWGVGYVVVRYRKNGVLKRLKATPLTALEYLSAQALSRLFLLMFTLIVIWAGCDLIFDFDVAGSYVDLFLVFFMGSLSVTALGLLVASRGTSEEFTSGLLNFITWPMMFLSEVWFSLEGAPDWVKASAKIFPLTHMLTAARSVMNDGAALIEIIPQLVMLAAMTVFCLALGAMLFSWNR